MLRVYHSNRLDVLEALMEFIVERQRLDDPFQAEMVLVQSTGMAQWLQMTLAARFGIAANIEFPLPASFIWDMFVRVLKDIPGESAFSKQSMSWKLMTLLPQHLDEDDFILLRQYLSDDGDKRKLFQLAARVADLYDQYLVYRPEWLMRWEADQRVEGLGDAQQWQAPLWKALVSYTAGRRNCRAATPPSWGSRSGTAPISTSALSVPWKKRTNRPPGRKEADEPPAVARLHLRFRAAAGLSSGAAGAG